MKIEDQVVETLGNFVIEVAENAHCVDEDGNPIINTAAMPVLTQSVDAYVKAAGVRNTVNKQKCDTTVDCLAHVADIIVKPVTGLVTYGAVKLICDSDRDGKIPNKLALGILGKKL